MSDDIEVPSHVGASLTGRGLKIHSRCDICGKPRNKGKHDNCSRIRKQAYDAKHAKGEG